MNNSIAGILWMTGAAISFGLGLSIIKYLSHSLNSFTIIFWLNFFILFFISAFFIKYLATMRTVYTKLYAIKGIVTVGGTTLATISMKFIPVSVVAALDFTTPLFTILLAILVLKEKFYKHRVVGLAIGCCGILIITRPGSDLFQMGSLIMILATSLWAIGNLLAKKLSVQESTKNMMFFCSLSYFIAGLPLAIIYWDLPSQEQFFWIIALSSVLTIELMCIYHAYRITEFSLIMPFTFFTLIVTSIAGAWFFDESPNIWVWIGGAFILGGATYIIWKDQKFRKKKI